MSDEYQPNAHLLTPCGTNYMTQKDLAESSLAAMPGSAAAMIDLITRRGQYEMKSATARQHGYIEDAKLIAARAAGLGEAIEVLQAYTEKPLPNEKS